MRSKCAFLLALAAILRAQNWTPALPGYHYEFPRDHFNHAAYQTEWWYYTGNLKDAAGRRFGFELTFFRQGVPLPKRAADSEAAVWRPDQLYLAHFALSDIAGQRFYHSERLNRAGPGIAGADLANRKYWNGNWQVYWKSLESEEQSLEAIGDDFTLRLDLNPQKPPVIHGKNGVSQKGPEPGQASHYISFTRLGVRGQLRRGGKTVALNGLAWMDHEFFTEKLDAHLAGWDWFAIQLDTNEELMLYRLRDKSGQADSFSSGTYVDERGAAHFLDASQFTLSPGGLWQSAASHAKYPLAWEISVPSLNLHLAERTPLNTQELFTPNSLSPSYWEGAVNYEGTLRGRPARGVGYLEMTGYGSPFHLGR